MIAYIHIVSEGNELMKGLSNIACWYDSIAARESFKKTIADMDDMKAA